MYSVEAESIVKEYAMTAGTFDDFMNNLELNIISRTPSSIEIDLKNAHPSLANALRRTLISEIPCIAIHNVSIRENDTVFPDEYIAHRLGLVPIDVDPSVLEYNDGDANASNVLNFKLNVKNTTNDVQCLYSDQIIWTPMEGQEHLLVSVKPGVLICKMAPGNIIDMDLSAEKGVGKTHAKWSPVSLCSYKIMPRIVLEKEFYGEVAVELQACFSPGVIEIIDNKAVVVNPRIDSMSREVFRHDKFKDNVKILRENGWFCFTIEAISLDPLYLFKTALQILINKCKELREEVLLKIQ